MTREALSKAAGVSHTTVTQSCRGAAVSAEKAALISKVLGEQVENLFTLTRLQRPFSNKTVLEHHRFIHTVLVQAEREMLVLSAPVIKCKKTPRK